MLRSLFDIAVKLFMLGLCFVFLVFFVSCGLFGFVGVLQIVICLVLCFDFVYVVCVFFPANQCEISKTPNNNRKGKTIKLMAPQLNKKENQHQLNTNKNDI